MLRNYDNYQNPYQYLTMILSYNYNTELPTVKNLLWILDYKLTESEIEAGETDPNLTKDHFTIIDRTIYFCSLYKTNYEKYITEKEMCENTSYNDLFPPITEDEIKDIISITESKNLQLFDILSKPLLGGNILSQTIFNLEHQIKVAKDPDQMKTDIENKADLIKSQYDNTFVDTMNDYINRVRKIIDNYLQDNDEIYDFPNTKSYVDPEHPVGLKMNGAGYKQCVFDNNWKVISTSTQDEVENLNSFYIKRTVKNSDGTSSVEDIKPSSFSTQDQNTINTLSDSYNAVSFQRERRYGNVGLRGQLESMYSTSLPDVKSQLESELDSVYKIRKQMLKDYGTLT